MIEVIDIGNDIFGDCHWFCITAVYRVCNIYQTDERMYVITSNFQSIVV